MTIDLSRLPVPDIVTAPDPEGRKDAMAADLVARMAAVDEDFADGLRETDPAMKLIEAQTGREAHVVGHVNDAVKAVLLAHSTDKDLDNVAALVDVERQVVDPGNPDAVPPVAPTYESDARLRRRVGDRWNTLSGGGPEYAYRAVAMAADGRVADAAISSPQPCEIVVAVLPVDGADAAEVLAAVTAAVTDPDNRPMGDRVTAELAAVTDFTVAATLTVAAGPDEGVVQAAAEDAIAAYVAWSDEAGRTPLGRSISLALLNAACAVSGVVDVVVAEPAASIACGKAEAARCVGITLSVVRAE